jgi:hypothetical protein
MPNSKLTLTYCPQPISDGGYRPGAIFGKIEIDDGLKKGMQAFSKGTRFTYSAQSMTP